MQLPPLSLCSSFWDLLYMEVAVGSPVPPHTPHAISVSLPKWRDVVGYEEGDKRVVDCMMNGYPRFFIHLKIAKLASICHQRYAIGDELCMLFPTQKLADHCREFIQQRLNQSGVDLSARLVQLFIFPNDGKGKGNQRTEVSNPTQNHAGLHIVFFPSESLCIAKEFWQHTGLGISSRLAEKCLALLEEGSSLSNDPNGHSNGFGMRGRNRHYYRKPPPTDTKVLSQTATEELGAEHTNYFEERYGRNLPTSEAFAAKGVLRSRIAQGLVANQTRGRTCITSDDVYLYPCGMAAIWSAHQLLLEVRPPAKSVCFGFAYTDTIKVLQKWGHGSHFMGHGLDSDIDELERIISDERNQNPDKPPLLALFTEIPSNPLLRSANLSRLRELADKHDFLIVIDETIGNYVNVDVLPYADIVVCSLTKVFSGASNVMGGSLVLNSAGRHYDRLKTHLNKNFEDIYFDEDAIYMERNSRDFKRRVRVIDANAEAACDFLRTRSIAGGLPTAVIKEVFYPKYVARDMYDACRKTNVDSEDGKVGGFGGLFSLTFTSMAASKAFFDTLECYKGPSLGTNFTLACPFTILAHFTELDWANQYGVERSLVRISIGMEERETLLSWMKAALDAAEAVTPC